MREKECETEKEKERDRVSQSKRKQNEVGKKESGEKKVLQNSAVPNQNNKDLHGIKCSPFEGEEERDITRQREGDRRKGKKQRNMRFCIHSLAHHETISSRFVCTSEMLSDCVDFHSVHIFMAPIIGFILLQHHWNWSFLTVISNCVPITQGYWSQQRYKSYTLYG